MSSAGSAWAPIIAALGRFAFLARICGGERRSRCASVPSGKHRQASICPPSHEHSAHSPISPACTHPLDPAPRPDPDAVGSDLDGCAASGAVAPGAVSGEIDDRTSSPPGRTESYNATTTERPIRLAAVSAAAAALLGDSACGSFNAEPVPGHPRRDAGAPQLLGREFRLPAPGNVPAYATEPIRSWLMTMIVLLGLMALPLAILWRSQPEQRAFELAAASSHGMKGESAQTPNAPVLVVPAQVSPVAIVPENGAAASPPSRDAVAAKASENPPGGNEQHGVGIEKRAAASVGAAPSRNEKPADASSPLRASGEPFDLDRQRDVRKRARSKWQFIRHCWSMGQLVERSSTSTPSCVRSLDTGSGLTAAF